MNKQNRIGGLKAKRIGESWEYRIQSHAFQQGFHVIPIPPGCKQVSKFKLIRVRTPFDFVLIRNDKCIFIDCKTTKLNRFPMDKATKHQIISLSKCEDKGHLAGLLVWFREIDQVVFYSSKTVLNAKLKPSLVPNDGIHIGSCLELDFEKVI